MTPTRALVGLAVVAAAGYVVINSTGGQGPQYVGDFPALQQQSQAESPPVTHDAGAPQPGDPQHYSAQPVGPEAPPAVPGGPAGPGAVPPAGPPLVPGSGEGGYPGPGAGTPLGGGLPSVTDLLKGLPTLDVQGFCRLTTGQVVALPCDQIPPVPQAPAP
jgi:hypothetical protein